MSNPDESLKSSVVRFYHANGNVVGAGFLVAEHYLLTCAHVVAAALTLPANTETQPEQPVKFDFPLLAPGYKLKASVVFWLPVAETVSSEDIAVLRLLTPPPANAKSVSIASLSGAWGHPLGVFGFPKGYADGVWATATLRGETGKRWIQLDAKMGQDRPLDQGFSGSPVWDEPLNAVVGMTVAAEKDKQQSVTLAYMMPKDVLRRPLNYLRQQTLIDILDGYGSEILSLIQRAYRLCRPQNTATSPQRETHNIIDELSNTTAGAGQEEDKLVQFVAALVLELDTQLVETSRDLLQQWGHRYAKDFDAAKTAMQALTIKRQKQKIAPNKPMLLVNVQEDASRESLSVEAWVVLDPAKYNAKTLQGSHRLVFFAEDDDYAHLSEQKISYDDLPILLESYLMQLCDGSEYECDPSELTLYFVLPSSLLNKPLERLMPGDEDEPLGIGNDDCLQVILALQNRSSLGGFRANSRWKKAWRLKDTKVNVLAHEVFADSSGLKSAGIVGLQKLTSLNSQSDPQLIAKQGIPLAVWVRGNQVDEDWAPMLLEQVLSYPLNNVLEQVLEIRRNTDPLGSEAEYAQSSELGHHLAILWDDPNLVPPTANATLSAAKL